MPNKKKSKPSAKSKTKNKSSKQTPSKGLGKKSSRKSAKKSRSKSRSAGACPPNPKSKSISQQMPMMAPSMGPGMSDNPNNDYNAPSQNGQVPPDQKNQSSSRFCIIVGGVVLVIVIIILVVTLSSKKSSKNVDKFDLECLTKHNIYRAKHFVGELTVDLKLTRAAQKWADHMAFEKTVTQEPGQPYGENVMKSKATVNEVPDGTVVTDHFYKNYKKFNYKKPEKNLACCSQFAQVVWKNTKTIGCAFNNTFGAMYVSCKYYPPGDIAGQFKSNVFSPK